MRVLHVIPSVSPDRGGPSLAVQTMSRWQAEYGLTVEVATTVDDGIRRFGRTAVPVQPWGDGVRIHWFPRQTKFYTASWPLARWLGQNICAFDVVHIHALFSFAPVPAAYFASMHGIPYIIGPLGTLGRWGMESRRPRLKRASLAVIEQRILRGAAAIHYTSETEREEAAEFVGSDRGVVIPLGIDLEPFSRLPPAERFLHRYPELRGRRIVLFLSRIDAKKGLDLLLPAIAALRDRQPDIALVVAGHGDVNITGRMRRLAGSLRLQDHVIWTGFLDGENKLEAFAAATLFALPSRSENFGIAAVEAMAAGLPVILGRHVGIATETTEHGAGLLTECETGALAHAIETILRHRDNASLMGQHGRELVTELYSADVMTRRLVELYRSMVRPLREVMAPADQGCELSL